MLQLALSKSDLTIVEVWLKEDKKRGLSTWIGCAFTAHINAPMDTSSNAS